MVVDIVNNNIIIINQGGGRYCSTTEQLGFLRKGKVTTQHISQPFPQRDNSPIGEIPERRKVLT